MAKRVTYPVIAYGDWTRPRRRDFREQCCDCGLIHRLDFRIVDGKIEFRTRRDDRATAAARRYQTVEFSARSHIRLNLRGSPLGAGEFSLRWSAQPI
jgi:hypothetical protein